MRPPSALLPSHTILCWLFCTTLLMFFNISANAQQSEPPMELGLAGINPNMELPKDSWFIRSRDELERYKYTKYNHKDTTFSPCKVDINGGGFEVFYDELASSKGCTVDFIVNLRGHAFFTAKMMDLDKNCISKADNDDGIVEKSNDNLIPFVFGYTNNELMELNNGPVYEGVCTNEAECKKAYGKDGKCIETTMLEIGWSRSNDESIYGHLHQVGEPVSSWNIKMDKKEEWDGKMNVFLRKYSTDVGKPALAYLIGSGPNQSYLFIEKEKGDQPFCNIPSNATPTPLTWQIKSTNTFLNGNYLLSLHFFPQKSTVYHYGKEGEWKVNSVKKIDGPKCKEQSFFFHRSFALALFMVGQKPEPKTPSTSTQSTTKITIGSTGMPTTEKTTTTTSTAGPLPTSKQTTVETTATISEFPQETTTTTSKQAADSGSSTILIISIAAGLIAFIILIAILIYCLCCRKKEVANDKEEDEEEDSSEVENSEVFENFVKKQQPSLMMTEKKKPTGEITTDWIDYETIVPKKKSNVV